MAKENGMLNKHSWNWFYHNVIEEAKCFYGVELKFIYCGVIITDVYGNKRAEFVSDNFVELFNNVQVYMIHNFKRRAVRIIIKGGKRNG